jgi:CYTH domain-containing protein
MAKEIERKFLVADAGWREIATAQTRIAQFYLVAGEDRTIRVRIRDSSDATLTLKFSGRGPGRDEFEYPIPLAEAEEMRSFAVGRVIEKTRHHVHHDGYLYEVDEFDGALAGLVIAELETPDAVPADRLPGWIGEEVTHERRFYNARLALRDAP